MACSCTLRHARPPRGGATPCVLGSGLGASYVPQLHNSTCSWGPAQQAGGSSLGPSLVPARWVRAGPKEWSDLRCWAQDGACWGAGEFHRARSPSSLIHALLCSHAGSVGKSKPQPKARPKPRLHRLGTGHMEEGTGALPTAADEEPAAPVSAAAIGLAAADAGMSPRRGSLDPRRAAAGRLQSSRDPRLPVPIHVVEGERKGGREEQAGGSQGRQPETGPAPAQCLAPAAAASSQAAASTAAGVLSHCYLSNPSIELGRVQSASSLGPEHGSFPFIPRAGNLGKPAEPLAHPATWSPGGAHSVGEPLDSLRAKAVASPRRSFSTRG
jgi:hypothetical protein